MNKAVFLALAILPDGTRDVLVWFQANAGARFWAKVLSDLRNRGVQDILIAVVDGPKGFPQTIEAAFPKTRVQICIVHLLRQAMSFASYKDRKAVATALKAIYTAIDAEAAEVALAQFEQGEPAARYPAITPGWHRAWSEVIAFLDVSPTGVPADLHHPCDQGVRIENPQGRQNKRPLPKRLPCREILPPDIIIFVPFFTENQVVLADRLDNLQSKTTRFICMKRTTSQI